MFGFDLFPRPSWPGYECLYTELNQVAWLIEEPCLVQGIDRTGPDGLQLRWFFHHPAWLRPGDTLSVDLAGTDLALPSPFPVGGFKVATWVLK